MMTDTQPISHIQFPVISAPMQVQIIPATHSPKQRRQSRQLRTAAYCRVSTNEEEQVTSYEAQLQYFTDKIMQNPNWSMVQVFADKGLTGTQAKKRPEFLKMIDECRKGKIDQILIKSVSRFARNTVDSLSFIRELKEMGIAIIFEKENINTLETDSELLITLMSCFAQAESESISGNIRWGKVQSFKNGKVSYCYANWYGYCKGEDGKPEIIPDEGAVVQWIFKSYRDGASTDEIRSYLNRNGIPTKQRKAEWKREAVRRILQNERYCGDALLQKTYIENCISKKVQRNTGERAMYLVQNCHAPIIDRTLFQQVQAEMARRSGKRKVSDKTRTEQSKYSAKYALSELLYCGDCGTPYRRCTWRKNGKVRIVWRCISRLDYGTKYCKRSPTLDEDKIHEAIRLAIQIFLLDSDQITGLLHKVLSETLTDDTEQFNPYAAAQRIKELQERLMSVLEQAVGSSTPCDSSFQKISDEIVALQRQLDEHSRSKHHEDDIDRQINELCKLAADAPKLTELYDDRLTRKLIEGIKVVGAEKLMITFKGGVVVEQRME